MSDKIKQLVTRFCEWAPENGWKVVMKRRRNECVPAEILRRYGEIPADYLEFTALVAAAVRLDDKARFLCCDDFLGLSGLRWDAFEQLSLEAAEDDQRLSRQIKRFWDKHLPVYQAVSGDYAFLALDTRDWVVVQGVAPEFEDTRLIASSFSDLLMNVMADKIEA